MSEPVTRAARWRGIVMDAALLLFVMGLGVKASFGVYATRDADAGDECAYLMAACAMSERGLPPVEGAPLYVVWDSLLLRTGTPLEDVPLLGWSLLAILLPGATFLLVRALDGGRLAALVAGGGLLATTLIDVWPYPMHLATLVLVLGTALAARLGRAGAASVLGLALLTATYARPEFLYCLYLLLPLAAVAGCWALVRRPRARLGVIGAVAVFATGAALLFWAFGSPKGEGGRSLTAFGQHYAVNRFESGARTEQPWHNWELYIRSDFGEVTSIVGAWQSNREAVRWHLERNARRAPEFMRAVAAPRVDLWLLQHPYAAPHTPSTRHPATESLVRWVMLAWLLAGFVGVVRGVRLHIRGEDIGGRLPVVLLMLALVIAPAVAASLVIFPRFHYMIPTIVLGSATAAAGFRYLPCPQRCRGRLPTLAALVVTAIVLALIVPNRATGWCIQRKLGKARFANTMCPMPTVNRTTARTIRELGLSQTVWVLETSGAPCFYVGSSTRYFPVCAILPGEGFLQLVKRADIGLVIIEPVLAFCPQLHNDPDFRALVEGKESTLFRLVPLPGYPGFQIAVRRDLMTRAREEGQ